MSYYNQYGKKAIDFVQNTFKALTRPTDVKAYTKMSILLLNQSTLNDIVAECKPKAGGAEFQVHYRALIVRAALGDTELIVTIPTTFYNFPQKVNSASVDYQLTEVTAIGNNAQPLSTALAANWAVKLPFIEDLRARGATVEIIESDCGSIHRHPGDFGFSATDYDKNPAHPGVIYRKKEATNLPQTDSVLYIPYTGQPKIVVTETRILDIEPDGDGVAGTYTQIPTFTIVKQDATAIESFSFDDLLGATRTASVSSSEFTMVESMGKWEGDREVLASIATQLCSESFKANTLMVTEHHITTNSYVYNPKSTYKKPKVTVVNTTKSKTTAEHYTDLHPDVDINDVELLDEYSTYNYMYGVQ